MDGEKLEAGWRDLAGRVAQEMREWREGHPRASLREIEAALDERWAAARAQIVAEAAMTSPLTRVGTAQAAGETVACPRCGEAVVDHGPHARQLTTQGDQRVVLERSYAVCPACGAGLFPPG